MKKMLALILALVLILSLAACGGGDDEKTPSNEDKTPSSSQQQQQTQTSKPDESKPAGSQPSGEEKSPAEKADETAAGFGSYNGQPIVWRVLDIDDENEKALLVTKDIVALMAFAEGTETWEDSLVRQWLNNDFINEAFTDEEAAIILSTDITIAPNAEYGTSGGNSTTDKVFLLSEAEVNSYFIDGEARRSNYNGELEDWWTITSGEDETSILIVMGEGTILTDGYSKQQEEGIRPAIWVNLSDEQADPVEDEPDNNGSEEATDPGTSGSAEGSHKLFDIEELAGVSEFPDFAKKAIGDLRWCDDLSRSMPQYEIYYNAYMKNVTQEDFETYIANLNANAPKDPVEGEEFVYYWDWGQIIGTYHPADGILDVGLAIYEE